MRNNFITGVLSLGLLAACAVQGCSNRTDVPKCDFQAVPIVGGGFVPGLVFSNIAKDVRFARTDMGGAYRWDIKARRWVQMLDFLSIDEANLQGVESIAIDPRNPSHVMLACGTYTRENGAILVSHDGGNTFSRTDVPFGMGGNENGRGNGERLSIDPKNSNVAFMGTRNDGLWKTSDDGRSWQKVAGFPDVGEPVDLKDPNNWQTRGSGVISVLFCPADSDKGKGLTSRIFAFVSLRDRESAFVSTDGGDTWNPVEKQPTRLRPTHAVLSSDDVIYVSYADTPGPSAYSDGYVYSYNVANGEWKNISPIKADGALGFGYAAVAVDRQNPNVVVATTHYLGCKYNLYQEEIFYSQDRGESWKPLFTSGFEYDHSLAPYTAMAPLHWMFDVEIDPFNSNHLMFVTGFGGWETFNLSDINTDKNVRFSIMSQGIEETVPLELYCPHEGARLISGIGDYGGYTHFDITKVCESGAHSVPFFGNTNAVAGAWHAQNVVFRSGVVFNHRSDTIHPISYSLDSGATWQMCKTVPERGAWRGSLAVGSDGKICVWTPRDMGAYRTANNGDTWSAIPSLPKGMRVEADKENPAKFYSLDILNKTLYVSADTAKFFVPHRLQLNGYVPLPWDKTEKQARGDRRGGQDRVYSTPGHESDLWIASYDGLYHLDLAKHSSYTDDGGLVPEAMSQVSRLYGFGFGKGRSGLYPSLYIIGVVNGVYGFYLSNDEGRSWQQLNDDDHQYGLVLQIIGDMQEYGRFYIATHGRGIITGKVR
ncbi:MAG: exo-alpha-sialidase [Bacteroidales bacterium]|nr:exo-alpha-sialidase [Bacteroidales bacterium]